MILHLSQTPLVNAPGNLCWAFNQFLNSESRWYYEKNYPNPITTPYGSKKIFEENRLDDSLKEVSHVIIHNFLSENNELIIRNAVSKAKFYRHIHSPPREGPIFRRKIDELGRDKMKYSVVCQYQQTLWADFRPLPNIVMLTPCNIPKNQFSGVIFNPTHQRAGRYNAKVNQIFLEQIDAFKRNFPDLYFEISGLPLENLHKLRCGFSVLIDEVITGGFHLSSIEGLSSANIVINGAKDYVIDSFISCLGIPSRPPFLRSTPMTIQDDLTNIALNYNQFKNLRKESINYFKKFLSPDRLIRHWSDYLEVDICQ